MPSPSRRARPVAPARRARARRSAQLPALAGPAERPLGERASAAAEPAAELVVVEEPLEHRRDLERVAAAQEQALVAVLEQPAEVRRRQHDRPPGREELRQLRREAVVVEVVGAARLDEHIGEAHVPRHLGARLRGTRTTCSSIGRSSRSRKLDVVAPEPDEPQRAAGAVHGCDGQVEAPHLGGVRAVRVPGVDDHRLARRRFRAGGGAPAPAGRR